MIGLISVYFVPSKGNHMIINDDQLHTLKILRTEIESSNGIYTATARNEHGYVSCHCNLIVDKGIRAYIAPEFICSFPEQCALKEGDTLKLTAQIEAYPAVGRCHRRTAIHLYGCCLFVNRISCVILFVCFFFWI